MKITHWLNKIVTLNVLSSYDMKYLSAVISMQDLPSLVNSIAIDISLRVFLYPYESISMFMAYKFGLNTPS